MEHLRRSLRCGSGFEFRYRDPLTLGKTLAVAIRPVWENHFGYLGSHSFGQSQKALMFRDLQCGGVFFGGIPKERSTLRAEIGVASTKAFTAQLGASCSGLMLGWQEKRHSPGSAQQAMKRIWPICALVQETLEITAKRWRTLKNFSNPISSIWYAT